MVIAVLCGVIVSIGLVYAIAGGIAMLQRRYTLP